MKYLFSQWEKIYPRLKGRPVFFFLDFDGTLSPIARTPGQAALNPRIKTLIRRLSLAPGHKVAVISGRALSDIKRKVGLKNIIYAGNHGLEIEGPKIRFEEPGSLKCVPALKNIKALLKSKLSGIKGVIIEDKSLSLSVHYRLAEGRDIAAIKTAVHEAAILDLVKQKVVIRPGKKVLEIKPAINWDKAKAVLWLLGRQKFALKGKPVMPIYIGDDLTDEDAFRALRHRGLTVFVGETANSSSAEYYLKDTSEVEEFLNRSLALC